MKQVIINLEENSGVRCGDSHVIVTRAGIESNRIEPELGVNARGSCGGVSSSKNPITLFGSH
jgi:hypothetical protein